MGTRNLTCVVYKEEIKVAKYCQWDGYPDGQGRTILDFLTTKFDKSKFITELQKVKKATSAELQKRWKECGADPKSPFVTLEASEKFNTKYPHLSRNMGGEILENIQNGKVDITEDSKSFATDSLFCEWAYVLDLDNNKLEVYSGFNKKPLKPTARFFSEESKEGYFPIKLKKKYSLTKLPNLEKFLEDLEK